MTIKSVTPILNVSSVLDSIAWFEKVGWRRGFTWPERNLVPTFGSVCTEDAQIFLCLNGQGSRGVIMPRFSGDDLTDGVWMTWWLDGGPDELDALHAEALRQGLIVTYPPTDEPWCVREFHLRHPDGHMFRVSADLTDNGTARQE